MLDAALCWEVFSLDASSILVVFSGLMNVRLIGFMVVWCSTLWFGEKKKVWSMAESWNLTLLGLKSVSARLKYAD